MIYHPTVYYETSCLARGSAVKKGNSEKVFSCAGEGRSREQEREYENKIGREMRKNNR
jgi:hypothetical protein